MTVPVEQVRFLGLETHSGITDQADAIEEQDFEEDVLMRDTINKMGVEEQSVQKF